MNCELSQLLILESLDRSLTGPERADLEAHVGGCPRCREYHRLQTALDAALVRHADGVQPSAHLAARILERVRNVPRVAPEALREDRRHVAEAEFVRWQEDLRRTFHRLQFRSLLDFVGVAAVLIALGVTWPKLGLERLPALPSLDWLGAAGAAMIWPLLLGLVAIGAGAWLTVHRGRWAAIKPLP